MSGLPKKELLPIDEHDEFSNPYSDLRLFLASKIAGEIKNNQGSKKWSQQIQNELLEKIQPEFSAKFPMYRLGAAAIKKVWEKANYYYGKLSKDAMTSSGTLDIDYIIKENLRHLKKPQKGGSPYAHTQKIAMKISECVATLNGNAPDFDFLTRKVWSVHKHLLPMDRVKTARTPCELYTLTDKLILKTLLEQSAGPYYYTPSQLSEKIKERFRSYSEIATLAEEFSIVTVVSALLANKNTFDFPYQDDITEFITRQLEIIPLDPSLSLDANCLDIVQRILSLYPIASSLPTDISEEEVLETTEYLYSLASDEPFEAMPPIDGGLFLFIQAEIHLIRGQEMFDSLESVQDYMLNAYFQALTLPQLSESEPLEVLTWVLIDYHVDILSQIPSSLLSVIEQEIHQIELDKESLRFTSLAKKSAKFFSKMKELELGSNETMELIELWTLQNDMAVFHLAFEKSTPLYKHIVNSWQEQHLREYSVDHTSFVKSVIDSFETESNLKTLEQRVWILYRHLWYTGFARSDETAYARFLKWHASRFQDLPPKALKKKLEGISSKALPCTPHE